MFKEYYNALKSNFRLSWYLLPNIFTEIRLVFCLLPALLVWIGGKNLQHAAAISFFVLASTDFVDGGLARLLKQKTEYGRLLDPIADFFFGLFSVLAACALYDGFWFLVAVLILRQLVLIYVFKIQRAAGKTPRVNISGKAKTVAMGITVAMALCPDLVSFQTISIALKITIGLCILSMIEYCLSIFMKAAK